MLKSVGRKETTSRSGSRRRRVPFPLHFCFLCTTATVQPGEETQRRQQLLSIRTEHTRPGASPSLAHHLHSLGALEVLLGLLFSFLDGEPLEIKTVAYVLYLHCLAHSRHLIRVRRS